jgi:hypothetical protein
MFVGYGFHLFAESDLMDSIDKFAINACDSAYEKEIL